MEYEDKRCLGLFFLELNRHKEKLLDNNIGTQVHQQRKITTFESPYLPLYDDIIRFATMGDILLLGDFNARTKDEHTTMFDTNEAVYGEVRAEEVGLKRQAQDMSYGFVIYNGLSQCFGSDALTCWNPKGGASTVDYLMGSPSLIPEIKEFSISGRPIGLAADHAYLRFMVKDGCTRDVYAKESGLDKYRFTRETIDVYSCGVYDGMLDLDPFAPLDELTQGLSSSLHKAATNAFPHTTANPPPKLDRVIQNSCYDEECRDTRRCLQREVARGIYTHKQARATFQRLVRKKKRIHTLLHIPRSNIYRA